MEAWECSCCLCPFVPLTFWDFMWVWWHVPLKPAEPSHGFQCLLPEKDNSAETWLQGNREQALVCTERIKLCLGSPSWLHWKWRQREKQISPLPVLHPVAAAVAGCCPAECPMGCARPTQVSTLANLCPYNYIAVCTKARCFWLTSSCSINKNWLQTT